jgi:YidC/Oxa1 family membrane protein insertase
MERRALIAVVVSLLILVLYQEVVMRYVYPPRPRQEEVNAPSPAAEAPPPPLKEPAPEVAPLPAPATGSAPAPEGRHVKVDTELYTAVFTSSGARLESFELKKYRTTVAPNSPPQETIVPGEGGDLPFGVELRGHLGKSDSGAPYRVSGDGLDLKGDATGTLEFTWDSDSGTITKRFSFRGDRYEFDAVVAARNVSNEYAEVGVTWDKGIEIPPQAGSEIIFNHVVYLDGKKLYENTFDKLTAGKVVTPSPGNSIGWVGYSGQHFLAAMIPVDAQNYRLWLKTRDHTAQAQLLFPLGPAGAEQKLDIYIGPKDVDALERIGHGLARAVNLGWFDFIALPLLHLLRFLDGFTGNYGVAIILLTVGIKVLFIPLTQRSFRSMREMQKLQPQMTKIRERFKDDSEQIGGVAARTVHAVDQRPVCSGPFGLHAAAVRAASRHSGAHAAHGRQHVRAAVDDAERRRPDAATRDDDHAAHVYIYVCQLSFRFSSILACQQPADDCAAVLLEPHRNLTRGRDGCN